MKWVVTIVPVRKDRQVKSGATIHVFIRFNHVNASAMEDNNEKRKILIARYEVLLEKVHHDLKNELLALGLTIELLKIAPQEAMTRFPQLLDNLAEEFQQMKILIHKLMQAQSS